MLRRKELCCFALLVSVKAGCVVENPSCYVDTSARILGSENVAFGPITLEYCAQLCANNKFRLAGTEAGGECYCGDKLNVDKPKVSTHCESKCNANTSQSCGGNWAISIFEVKCSGAPEPPPKLQPELMNPCLKMPFSQLPFCNVTLSIDVRVADAISRMTLPEKIGALGTNTPAAWFSKTKLQPKQKKDWGFNKNWAPDLFWGRKRNTNVFLLVVFFPSRNLKLKLPRFWKLRRSNPWVYHATIGGRKLRRG